MHAGYEEIRYALYYLFLTTSMVVIFVNKNVGRTSSL